jgi:tRNA (cmo5U34)-methyltransferase
MADNATPHAASDYEVEVARTIPFHAELLQQAAGAAVAAVPLPQRWLDTGCGPGRLVAVARALAPEAAFFMADPSTQMLDLARMHNPELPADHFFAAPSDALPDAQPFDVITAVQCHHYYRDIAAKEHALRRCRALLAPGGVFVAFENVRAESHAGQELQRHRWATWMRAQGRDEAWVLAHLAREGTKYFPLRVSEHVALLARVGFDPVEVIWRAFGQAGFLALVPR